MRAAVVRERSGPFTVEELRDPEPKAGEVLVDIAACGVCHTDLHIHDGSVPFPAAVRAWPRDLGHDRGFGGGRRATLPLVNAWRAPSSCRAGSCAMCRAGREELCEPFFAHNRLSGTLYDGQTRLFDRSGEPVWMYSMGGLSEKAVMPARGVAVLPHELELTDSAIFGCALMTAYGAVAQVGQLRRGETVAVFGAGGIGGSVVQVARALGAGQIVAIDVDEGKLSLARELGATDTINASRDDPVQAVRDLTDGAGVNVAFEAIGHPRTFRQATEAATDGGRCVMVGIAPVGVTAEIEITRLVRRKLQVLGSFGGRPRHDLPALMALAISGELQLDGAIGARFTLDQATEAYSLLADGKITGRAIVEM